MRHIFGFLFLLAITSNVFAFNRERCGDLFPRYESYHPPYYSPLYVSTMFPSTSSYFSSTGPCSMYGDAIGRRAQYIETNYETILTDASKGKGEHISTLAKLSGCPNSKQEHFAKTMQTHIKDLMTNKEAEENISLLDQIDEVIKKDPELTSTCKL